MSDSYANKLRHDERGVATVEMAASFLILLSIVLGVIEFSYVYFQWNSANKAVQWGARLAAVSDPVASNLATLTGLESGTKLPGDPMPNFGCICYGMNERCAPTVAGTNCSYSATAMRTILLGRGNDGTHCVTGVNAGMCAFFPRLQRSNIVVSYQYTGLGYAGRKAGPVPTITVSLTDVNYEFILIGGIAGLSSLTFPTTATTTVTGEDLRMSWSAT